MTLRRLAPLVLLLALPGCAALTARLPGGAPPGAAVAPEPRPQPSTAQVESVAAARLAAPRGARTAEQLDTTTEAERAAAVAEADAPAGAAEERLGTTVASLGDPADPGFWIATPLVAQARPGRVVYPATGEAALVELRPAGGPASGGSRLSLPAMRALGAPLTGLPEVEVFGR